ncbi:hypothetical protein LCGC14_2780140, partial [marine sediment metagenome]
LEAAKQPTGRREGNFVAECIRCGSKAIIPFGDIHKFETMHRKVCPLKTHGEELLSGQTAAQTSKM